LLANSPTNNILTNNKQNTFPLDYFQVQDPLAVPKQTELPFNAVHSGAGARWATAPTPENYIYDFWNVIINYFLDIWDFFRHIGLTAPW
jgi:hypothetical protein